MVLCIDEKSQIQALDRTQPLLPSWINQVERFFALLTDQQIKRGAHRSTKELEAAITAYLDARNADPPTTSSPPSPASASLRAAATPRLSDRRAPAPNHERFAGSARTPDWYRNGVPAATPSRR